MAYQKDYGSYPKTERTWARERTQPRQAQSAAPTQPTRQSATQPTQPRPTATPSTAQKMPPKTPREPQKMEAAPKRTPSNVQDRSAAIPLIVLQLFLPIIAWFAARAQKDSIKWNSRGYKVGIWLSIIQISVCIPLLINDMEIWNIGVYAVFSILPALGLMRIYMAMPKRQSAYFDTAKCVYDYGFQHHLCTQTEWGHMWRKEVMQTENNVNAAVEVRAFRLEVLPVLNDLKNNHLLTYLLDGDMVRINIINPLT